jgi:signal transduction histidine kinase
MASRRGTGQIALMSLMLRLQVATWLLTAVTSGVLIHSIAPAAPPWRSGVSIAAFAAFLIWSGSAMALRRRTLPREQDRPDTWYGLSVAIYWAGNLTATLFFWLMMPFASDAAFLFTVLALVIATVFELLGTVRSPRGGPPPRSARLVPLLLPAMMIAFLGVHGGPFALPLIFFLLAMSGPLFFLRESLQRALQRSHEARIEAEQARDARTRFLAAASHDLGQPLQAARLFLDQALRSGDPERRARAGENARDALGAMERLLNQMLDHLRLGAGAMQPRPRDLTASEPIAHVAAQFAPAAALAGVELVAAPSSLRLSADRDMLERALGNLVDNALRHARCRRVLIGARRRSRTARFWVIDDGVGVPAAERDGLFDDYVQGSSAGGGERGGFGLGLASVRRMAELMGGRAGLDPGWCKGAAFFIELPLGGAERAPA